MFIQDVDYEATMAAKLSIAKKLFNLEKSKILNSSSFKNFLSENEVGISQCYSTICIRNAAIVIFVTQFVKILFFHLI